MRAQLLEAVAALNRLGIVPLLLKGAVPLFLSQANQMPVRMTSDLDLSVDAADEAGAQKCLGELGYLPLADARGMARPQDVGVLELRRNSGKRDLALDARRTGSPPGEHSVLAVSCLALDRSRPLQRRRLLAREN